MAELSEKVAIITGAAKGIGRAAVLEFLAEGAQVVAVGRGSAGLEELERDVAVGPDRLLTITADVSEEADVSRYLKAAYDTFGRVDILWNNAGIELHGDLATASLENYEREMAVNVRSVFLGLRGVLPRMIDQKSGAVINTASVCSFVAYPGNSVYAASKHAVLGLTRGAAAEVGAHGVRVNALCPGGVETPMLTRKLTTEKVRREAAQKLIPMGRLSEAEEQAKVGMFLASDRSSYVNGAAVVCDGGMISSFSV